MRQLRLGEAERQSWNLFLGVKDSKACIQKHYAELHLSHSVPRSGPSTWEISTNASGIEEYLISNSLLHPFVLKVKSLQVLLVCIFPRYA